MARLWFILLCYSNCAHIIAGLTSISNDSPEDALNYINEVQKKLILTPNPNITLVIGNTGSGKSTLVHYVAGGYSRMFSEDPPNPNSINFRIRDELDPDRDRITLATESRTLIPVMSTDESHIVWVDSPGFGDTRNETVEIATMFLIKRVIENALNIKIVLVVNYELVTESRDDFDNLLSRATELMKNIKRFANSVSLVVSKAPPFKMRGRNYIEIFEDSIKNTTAQFMSDHRSVLERKRSNENKIQLIDALLEQPLSSLNEYYPRISIFWRPNDAGPFDKIGKMVTGRRYIRESILEHSSYAKVHMSDFGFPLTPLAQIKVRNMVQHTIDSISTTVQKIIDRLIVEMRQQIESTETTKDRLEIINIGINCIQTENNERAITLKQLSEQLMRLIRAYNVTSAGVNELRQIEQNEKNLHVLTSLIVAEKNSTDASTSHKSSNSDYYYTFLEQVKRFLTAYEIGTQSGIKNKMQETVRLISTILMSFDSQLLGAIRKKIESINGFQNRLEVLQTGENSIRSTGKKITLKQRIEQLKNLTYAYEIASINVAALNYIDRYEKSLIELKSLAGAEVQVPDWIAISSNAIDYQFVMCDWYSFLEETYQYFGGYESNAEKPFIDENNFATFTKRIRRNAKFGPTPTRVIEMNGIINITMQSPTYECNDGTLIIKGNYVRSSDIRDALVTKCSSLNDLTRIKVFVLDTFYVDSDLYLNKTKEVELRIMAPTWNIRKETTFYLDGIDGERQTEPAVEGSAGKHGQPGTNGGNFFGWANEIINGDWLSVELNGGQGGNGQDGTGSSDVSVSIDRTSQDEILREAVYDEWFTGEQNLETYYLRYFRARGYDPEIMSARSYSGTDGDGSFTRHTFRLYPDGCCGATGAGGGGGVGGYGGDSNFICSSNEAKLLPKISSSDGNNGNSGKNGKVCETWMIQLSFYTEYSSWLFWDKINNFESHGVNYLHCDKCPTRTQVQWVVQPGAPEQNPHRLHGPLNVAQAMIEFKSFLLENMNDPAVKIAQKAYEIINYDSTINDAYKAKDFAMEANNLERHFFELHKLMDVSPLYDDLLKRVELFSVKDEANLLSVDQRVLALIYTMLLSKTTSTRSSHASDLIINIGKFLEMTVQNVDELDELGRIKVINEQRDEYNNVILAKIQEATNFIENDVGPEIEQVIPMLNTELKKAVLEIIALQSRTIHEIQKKEEILRYIRRNVRTRRILFAIEVISKVVEIIPVIGPIQKVVARFKIGRVPRFIAGVVGAGAGIIRKNLVDPKITKHEVPVGIQRLRNKMHQNDRKRIKATEMELNKLYISLRNYNVTNLELTEHLNEFLAYVYEMKTEKNLENYKVTDSIEECIRFLSRWQNVFAVSNADNKVFIVRSIQRAQYALTLIAASFPTYQQVSSNDDHIVEVVKAIEKDRESLEALRRFEDEIYSEIMLMVDEMYEYLMNVEENLVNKSSVALDVMNWKVKKTLRNVHRKLMDELTQFEVQSNVNECMIRINVAIKVMVDIYDRIQSYQKDSKLITVLSDLHTAKLQDSDIIDAELKNILNELQLNLQTNLVLAQYFRVLGAFKQAVYPYAADYLDAYELPPSLLVNNSSSIITHASQQIQSLSKKLREYNDSAINENDELIHSAYFDRYNGSRGPFYVWQNSEERDRIGKLFEGKEIFLFADIRKSDNRNAIKFNKIKLEFHTDNETANDELHGILQSFHVSLKHMGDSNYRCNDTFYTIPSRPWNIEYSIAERNQNPADQNFVHGKLSAGTSLLSPYTMWSMQLLYGPFEQLKPFVDFVDIELHGFGLYVKENAPICETNLEKYYSVMRNW